MKPDHTTPAALAEKLLADWETHACPVRTPAYQAAHPHLLERLTEYSALLLRPDDLNVGSADARAVLRHATAFRLGRASAAGPGRATRLTSLLTTDLHLFPPTAPFPSLRPTAAVLSLLSGILHELEMDELTEIVETIQHTLLTPDTEMVFGHGILPEADEAGLQVWLLVGYGAE